MGPMQSASSFRRHGWTECAPNCHKHSQTAVLEGDDALIILTEWREFRSPNCETIKAALKSLVIFDGRHLCDPRLVPELGLEYLAIGW